MSIKIMIDSASDISKEEAAKLGISMVPMQVRIGKEEYWDGVDLLPSQFYEKLIESSELPKTSQVTPYQFEEALKKCIGKDDQVIVITISSKLSGTYASACQAAENFDGRVFVVDSLNAAIGERLLCQYALRLIEQGEDAVSIVEKLNEKKKKIQLMALLGTLEYLKKGGRISSAVAFAGEMLSLKPVIALVDGEVKLVGKALGSKKGNNLLNKLIQEREVDFTMPYGVIWSGLNNTLLEKYVQDSANLWEAHAECLPSYMLGGTIGTHIGPGAIGVAFFEK